MLQPGYKKARIAPLVGHGGLSSARASIRTPYGTLASDWHYEGGKFTLVVEVPVNTTAEVVIQTTDPHKVLEGDAPLESAEGVRVLSFDKGRLTLGVASGRYQFRFAN